MFVRVKKPGFSETIAYASANSEREANRPQTLSARVNHDNAMMSERLKRSLVWRNA